MVEGQTLSVILDHGLGTDICHVTIISHSLRVATSLVRLHDYIITSCAGLFELDISQTCPREHDLARADSSSG